MENIDKTGEEVQALGKLAKAKREEDPNTNLTEEEVSALMSVELGDSVKLTQKMVQESLAGVVYPGFRLLVVKHLVDDFLKMLKDTTPEQYAGAVETVSRMAEEGVFGLSDGLKERLEKMKKDERNQAN